MLLNPSRFGGSAPPPAFLVDAADFDGTDNLTAGAMAGAADSKLLTMSFWMRLDVWGNNDRIFMTEEAAIGSLMDLGVSPNRIIIELDDTGGSTRLNAASGTLAVATPYHVLLSIDMANTAKRHLYINDVSNVTWTAYTDSTLDFTYSHWGIGAQKTTGNDRIDGQLAEFYFAPGVYIDFSVEANRRLFRSATGKPVNLGTNGSVPTGTAPLIYLHLDNGEAPANFALNRGTGGNFTVVGVLTTGAWSPSD